MNKKISIEQKIQNSKFDFIKKALYFIIAPIVILLIGVILLPTAGFSKGVDFAGGQTFNVYVNDEAKLDGATVYDLSEAKDYDEIYNKISLVLNENKASIVSYQTTKVNLEQYNVYSGQAVKVTFQVGEKDFDSTALRADLIDAFGYSAFDGAVSAIDEVPAVATFDWAIAIMASILFGLVAAIIYMVIRFSNSAIFVMFIQTALDIFMTLSLLLICRVPVNLSIGVIVLVAFVLSLANSFVFYNKAREIRKAGIATDLKNADMANMITKQTMFKKSMIYIGGIVASLLFAVLSTNAISMASLGIMFALLSTYYTSTFVMPALWALVDKPRKAKKKV